MKNYVVLVLVLIIFAGCSAHRTDVVYGSGTWYQQELKTISMDLNNGTITQAEYEAMKAEIENQHLKWRAGARRGVRP